MGERQPPAGMRGSGSSGGDDHDGGDGRGSGGSSSGGGSGVDRLSVPSAMSDAPPAAAAAAAEEGPSPSDLSSAVTNPGSFLPRRPSLGTSRASTLEGDGSSSLPRPPAVETGSFDRSC